MRNVRPQVNWCGSGPWYEGHAHIGKCDNVEGNWEFPRSDGKLGFITKIFIEDILHLLIDSRLKMIDLCDIAWKGKHYFPHHTGPNCYCCKGNPDDYDFKIKKAKHTKYKSADPSYPGIVLENAPNPYDSKYRMIDGRHRLMKLLHSTNVTSSLHYVLDYDEIKKYIIVEVYSHKEKKFIHEKFEGG